MTEQDTLAWIAEVFEEPPEEISPDTRRSAVAGWDSLGTLTLLAELDEKFDIQLSEQQMSALDSVNDVLELLRSRDKITDG